MKKKRNNGAETVRIDTVEYTKVEISELIIERFRSFCIAIKMIHMISRFIKNRFFIIVFLLCAACTGADTEVERNFSLAVWAENLDYEEYEKIYPALSELDVELYLAVKEGTFPHPSLSKMKFRAWLLLDKEKGYWPSVWNAKEFFKLVKNFVSLYKDKINWIIFDLEPPWEIALKLSDILGNLESVTDVARFASELTRIFPPQEIYEEGKYLLKEIVEFLHENGLKAMVVTVPTVIDDFEDGDDDIQKKLGLPVVGIPWDEVAFMLYSTVPKKILRKLVRAEVVESEYFVFTYVKSALNFFSKEKLSIGIGLVGQDLFGNEGYQSPEEMRKDIAAGLAAGVSKFHIWTVDNMKKDGRRDLTTWLGIGYVEPLAPQPNSVIDSLRLLSKILD